MRLYTSPIAPSPRRVNMFMAEKNITDIELVMIDLSKMEHTAASYKTIAPNAKIPALELDNGTILRETMSICRYLENIYPTPNLMGETPEERAVIDGWSRMIEFELLLPLSMAFRHSHPRMAAMEHQMPEIVPSMQQRSYDRLAMLNEDLSHTQYVAGDRFSVADITAFVTISFFPKLARVDLNDKWTHLMRWYAEVKERPSVQT